MSPSLSNSHAKGVRTERLAELYYGERGWIVERTRWSKFGPKDFFGFADLILAVKEPSPWAKPVLVQVTGPSGASERRKLLRDNIAFLQRGFRMRLLVRLSMVGKRLGSPRWEETELDDDGQFVEVG